MKKFTCIICPRGCTLTVDSDLYAISVSGNACKRGEEYAIAEYTNPVRDLTLNIRVEGGTMPVVSARSLQPIALKKILPIARLCNRLVVQAPINAGDILSTSVLGEKLVATRSVPKADGYDG